MSAVCANRRQSNRPTVQMSKPTPIDRPPNRNKTVAALFAIPLLMFGFGYLMVPIYNIFCDLTGLNGKTGELSVAEVSHLQADQSRLIRVEFTANLNENMKLDFAPSESHMNINPGGRYQTAYFAHNLRDRAVIGQAVPSVSPSRAAKHFSKIECFCFGRQTFAPGEKRDMPVIFTVDTDLPHDIKTITLSYTFFDVTESDDEVEHDHSTHDHEHAVYNPQSAESLN